MPFLYGGIGLVLGVICGILFMRLKPVFGLKEAQKKLSEYIDKEAQNRVNILKETIKGMK